MSQVSQVSLSISGRKSAHNNIKIYFYIIMAQKHSPPNQKTLMTCVTPMTPMTHSVCKCRMLPKPLVVTSAKVSVSLCLKKLVNYLELLE